MEFTPGYLFGMAMQTIPEPRKVARDLFDLNLPRSALWTLLILVLVVSTAFGVAIGILFPPPEELAGTLFAQPLMAGIAESSIAIIGVFLIYWVGRALGGAGRFEDAIMTILWMEWILILFEMLTVLFMLFAPTIGLMFWVMGMVSSFWVLSHFTAELHGFSSALSVFFGIFITLLIVLLVVSVILTMAGVGAGLVEQIETMEGA